MSRSNSHKRWKLIAALLLCAVAFVPIARYIRASYLVDRDMETAQSIISEMAAEDSAFLHLKVARTTHPKVAVVGNLDTQRQRDALRARLVATLGEQRVVFMIRNIRTLVDEWCTYPAGRCESAEGAIPALSN